MTRRLALFDLDNTLLNGDSDHEFGEFLIRKGLVDADSHRARNNEFYQDYLDNRLDIEAYVAFTVGPILELDSFLRQDLIAEYVREVVTDMISDAATELVESHRRAGDYCVIITATNDLITSPIAACFQVDLLLATELERRGEHITGRIAGIPCYREGKVERVEQWLQNPATATSLSLDNSIFYSDSSNDLPLLERVTEPVVVDADERLSEIASQRRWRQISLR